MSISGTSHERADEQLGHYGRLLLQLTDVLSNVGGDLRLAMYRAHRHGMELEEIARRAQVEVADVQDAINTLSGEPEVDEWPIASWTRRCSQ